MLHNNLFRDHVIERIEIENNAVPSEINVQIWKLRNDPLVRAFGKFAKDSRSNSNNR